MCVLGSIIVVSVLSMMDFQQMKQAYICGQIRDCVIMVMTFVCTFWLGISEGIGLGVLLSIGTVLTTVSFPQLVTLGGLPTRRKTVEVWGSNSSPASPSDSDLNILDPSATKDLYADVETDIEKQETAVINRRRDPPVHEEIVYQYKNVLRFPQAQQIPGIAIVRMDASLFFANAVHFKKHVLLSAEGCFHPSCRRYYTYPDKTRISPVPQSVHATTYSPLPHTAEAHCNLTVDRANGTSRPTKFTKIWLVIIDCSAWIDIDLVGLNTLRELKAELLDKFSACMEFVHLIGPLRDTLLSAGIYSLLPDVKVPQGFDYIDDVIAYARSHRHLLLPSEKFATVPQTTPVAAADPSSATGIEIELVINPDIFRNNIVRLVSPDLDIDEVKSSAEGCSDSYPLIR
jgi:MFS superfamily sulfate permease-like transporter